MVEIIEDRTKDTENKLTCSTNTTSLSKDDIKEIKHHKKISFSNLYTKEIRLRITMNLQD